MSEISPDAFWCLSGGALTTLGVSLTYSLSSGILAAGLIMMFIGVFGEFN
jgi:hypothetical protein